MSYAVIFDVDGVLVDSYQPHWQSWQRLAEETGAIFSEENFAATFGQTSREIIRRFWPGDHDDQSVKQLDDRKEYLYREILHEHFPAMAGAVDLIDALLADGFHLGVGSSGPPENVTLTLRQLERAEVFEAVVTGRDVHRGKPDPQVYRLAAERLGVTPARCVVIEDAAPGIEAAHRAQMACVGLVSTGRTREELAAADLLVDALGALTPQRLRSLADQHVSAADD